MQPKTHAPLLPRNLCTASSWSLRPASRTSDLVRKPPPSPTQHAKLTPSPETQVFNRLKQVNRQLRFETVDLEYRYNTILFLDPRYFFPLDAPHALPQLSSLTQHV